MLTASNLFSFNEYSPKVNDSVFIAPTATLIGQVNISENSSVWFNTVLRGDEVSISVGANTNIQDGVVVHGNKGDNVEIGENVTIGHRAIIHGCHIKDGALIGMGAIVLDGAVIGKGALIAAGAVVTAGKHVPAGELWAGCPAKSRGSVAGDVQSFMAANGQHYAKQASFYLNGSVKAVIKI